MKLLHELPEEEVISIFNQLSDLKSMIKSTIYELVEHLVITDRLNDEELTRPLFRMMCEESFVTEQEIVKWFHDALNLRFKQENWPLSNKLNKHD